MTPLEKHIARLERSINEYGREDLDEILALAIAIKATIERR